MDHFKHDLQVRLVMGTFPTDCERNVFFKFGEDTMYCTNWTKHQLSHT